MSSNLKINIIFINIIIFLVLPFNFANVVNYDYGIIIFLSVFLICIFLSLLSLFFFYFLINVFKKFKINISLYTEIFIKFSLLWIFLTGIFFPVVGEHDAFLNLNLSVKGKYIILIKFFLILILFYILEKYRKSKYFFKFIIVYIIVNLIFVIFNIHLNSNNEKFKFSKINKFGNKNLIVLSFDGISNTKMFDEVQNNFELKKDLKDFIFFKDVTTGGPFTKPSMNTEINGNLENFQNSKISYDNILNDENLDVSVYESYSKFVLNKENTLNKGEYKNYSNNYKLNEFLTTYFVGSVGRWATYLSVPLVESIFYQQYYKDFSSLISFDKIDQIDPFQIIDTPGKIDLFEFDLIFNESTYDNDLENVVRMYHFTFSHWPIVVNENCEEVRLLKNIKSYDQESIMIKCISKKIINFLNLIKKNKVYDNSMIIIKSDHGKPNYVELIYKTNFLQTFKKTSYNNYYSTYPDNLKINDSFYWGYGRYKPFLMIKDANIVNKELKISNKHVFIHDLSATYCNFFYDKSDCKKYNRNNLVYNENLFKDYNYDIMLPVKKYSFQNLSDFKIYEITNTKTLLDSLLEKKIIAK